MNPFLALLQAAPAGCVLVDRAHAAELVQSVEGFNEEWLHWAELFAEYEGTEFLLLFFNSASPHHFEHPFVLFAANAYGLEFALDFALDYLSGANTRWAFLAHEPARARVQHYLQEHNAAINMPYRWDEQRRLH